MAILTRLFFRGTDEVIVRRAPQNKVFLIEALQCNFLTSATNNLFILDRHMKAGSNPVLGSPDTNFTPHVIATFRNTGTVNQGSFWVGQINQRTKYISIAYENATNIPFVVVIYGQLVSETKSNLIWEFITKRHR